MGAGLGTHMHAHVVYNYIQLYASTLHTCTHAGTILTRHAQTRQARVHRLTANRLPLTASPVQKEAEAVT